MSITKLMNDEKARDAYLLIATTTPPLKLADDYILAKLAGDKSQCLAIEEHLRDLVRVHFHVEEVRQALAQMERYKEMRKPGAGGSTALKAMGDFIARSYAVGDYDVLDDGRIQFIYSAPGKFAARPSLVKIKCRNMPGAVALLAAKYRRGFKTPAWRSRSTY